MAANYQKFLELAGVIFGPALDDNFFVGVKLDGQRNYLSSR
jgi:hypothetical protein